MMPEAFEHGGKLAGLITVLGFTTAVLVARSDADEWQTFAENQRRMGVSSPKLVCIDIQPYGSSQAPEREDILNIGGFSDAVFNVVSSFLSADKNRFVREVESIEL